MSIINITTEEHSAVLLERKNKLGLITLNRPERYNGVNHDLVLGLISALDKVRDDKDIRAVVITGAGRGFCAGADLGDFGGGSPEDVAAYIPTYYGAIIRRIMKLDKPVIAAIHGSAAGVGTAFALACDMRIMSADANIRYAFINIGLGPDGGAGWLLTRTVGYPRAFEIAVHGEKIPADRCLEWGLTNRVAPQDSMMREALIWADELADRPTLGVALTKRALQHALTHTIDETTVFEAENQAKALRSHDHAEGVQAFFQKRKPKFVGK